MQKTKGLIVALFCFILSVGFLAQLTRFDVAIKIQENRKPAPLPELAWKGLKAYPKKYDLWFSDHFGGRNFLIYWNSVFRNFVLNTPSSNLVLFGRDGWMYYTGDSTLELTRRVIPFDKKELTHLAEGYQKRKTFVNKQGAR